MTTIGLTEKALCSFYLVEGEMVENILCVCKGLDGLRFQIMGMAKPGTEYNRRHLLSKLWSLIKWNNLDEL